MGEVNERVARLSETELLAEFRTALVALYPILRRLDCIEDDTQPYDDFESVAECLWDVLVRNSLRWKYGLESPPDIGRYGFGKPRADGFIEITSTGSDERACFVEFLGCREFGTEPFNGVAVVKNSSRAFVPWGRCSARWVRS